MSLPRAEPAGATSRLGESYLEGTPESEWGNLTQTAPQQKDVFNCGIYDIEFVISILRNLNSEEHVQVDAPAMHFQYV